MTFDGFAAYFFEVRGELELCFFCISVFKSGNTDWISFANLYDYILVNAAGFNFSKLLFVTYNLISRDIYNIDYIVGNTF